MLGGRIAGRWREADACIMSRFGFRVGTYADLQISLDTGRDAPESRCCGGNRPFETGRSLCGCGCGPKSGRRVALGVVGQLYRRILTRFVREKSPDGTIVPGVAQLYRSEKEKLRVTKVAQKEKPRHVLSACRRPDGVSGYPEPTGMVRATTWTGDRVYSNPRPCSFRLVNWPPFPRIT